MCTRLTLEVSCSDVRVVIADSVSSQGLSLYFNTLTNNSVLIRKFNGSVNAAFSESTISDGNESNIILIQDSEFRSYPYGCALHFVDKAESNVPRHLGSAQMTLRNVTFSSNNIGPAACFDRVAMMIVNCTFEKNTVAAIEADFSKLIFQGNTTFRNNSADDGAGIQLHGGSYMYLKSHTHILFEANHASYVGGAIYSDSRDSSACFFDADLAAFNSTTVRFLNNTAGAAGTSLYGGLDSCCSFDVGSFCELFYNLFKISNTETDPSAIASDPYQVCPCDDNKHQPNCSYDDGSRNVYAHPGQEFSVRLAVVGGPTIHGVVPGVIGARALSSNVSLGSQWQALLQQLHLCSQLCRAGDCEDSTKSRTDVFLSWRDCGSVCTFNGVSVGVPSVNCRGEVCV